jgi:peroxiredoxin family protein
MLGFHAEHKPRAAVVKPLEAMPDPVVIFLQRDGYEPAWLAGSLALTAQAAGDAVTLVLSFEPLAAWSEARLGARNSPARQRADAANAADPMRLVTEARALGAKLVACETVVKLSGLTPESARACLDEVLGLQSIWKLTAGARVLSF